MVILGSFSKIFTIFLACPQTTYYLYINKHKLNVKVMKNEEDFLISDYEAKYEARKEAEQLLEQHFRQKIKPHLDMAKTEKDFENVKEMMRPMPLCASKTLIFRTILILEDERLKKN